MDEVETIVIGAGVVGLAVAREMSQRGNETSSRNNEVIHAGFMYPPGSLRGKLCRPGAEALIEYCQDRNVDVIARGKLVLALDDAELKLLHSFLDLGAACGVEDLKLLNSEEVAELEPEIQCLAALHSPSTAVVDTHALMLAYLGDAEAGGAVLALNSKVISGSTDSSGGIVTIADKDGNEFQLKWSTLINAAGLGARDVAERLMSGGSVEPPNLYYAKGSFFSLTGHLPFSHIIVPLGENLAGGGAFTIDIGGRGKFGPDMEWVSDIDYSVNPDKASQFTNAIRKYWKNVDVLRLQPDYAGVRPRTWGEKDPPGDWIIETPSDHGITGLVNLFGIETPGLTASLTISKYVADALVH